MWTGIEGSGPCAETTPADGACDWWFVGSDLCVSHEPPGGSVRGVGWRLAGDSVQGAAIGDWCGSERGWRAPTAAACP